MRREGKVHRHRNRSDGTASANSRLDIARGDGGGAAQALLKASGIVPDGPVVIAGAAPLITPVTAQLTRVGVPIAVMLLGDVSEPAIEGNKQAEAVRYTHGGTQHRVPASVVRLHNGIIPNVQLALGAGCEQEWNLAQHCWQPRLDAWEKTNRLRIAIAGGGAGIFGARPAASSGRLAALDAAVRLRKLDTPQRDRMARDTALVPVP